MKKKYDFQDLVQIVKALRAPDGCPWDRKQTHQSLRPCMTEEAAELLASIRIWEKTGSAENMREELGDIILQSVMHSVIAEEEALFTIEDVIDEISRKMIRRHPHVFADASGEKKKVPWEEIKKKEKEGKTWIETPLREIPIELPALARAVKVIKKAEKVYSVAQSEENELFSAVEDELQQLKKQTNDIHLEEGLSRVLWMICRIAQKRQISLEQGLSDQIETFIEKYEEKA